MFEPDAKLPANPDAHALTLGKGGSKIVSINAQTIKVACSNCNLRELCMPLGLSATE